MMRHLALILVLILAPLSSAFAEGHVQTLTIGQTLRGRFVQERHLTGFDAPLVSQGHFVLAPGRGLIWQSDKPFAVTTVITESGLVQSSAGAETMRLPAARLPFLSHLYDMLGGALAGDWHALDAEFIVTRSGGADNWRMDLVPRRASDPLAMPFRAITAKGGRFLDDVLLAKAGDGDFDRLRFLEQTISDAPLSAVEEAALRTVR